MTVGDRVYTDIMDDDGETVGRNPGVVTEMDEWSTTVAHDDGVVCVYDAEYVYPEVA